MKSPIILSFATAVLLIADTLAPQIFIMSAVAADAATQTATATRIAAAEENLFTGHTSTYSAAPVLLRYAQLPGGIRKGQQTPTLILFADGHLQVFYPDYMKRAGNYTAQLNPEQLAQLQQQLADPALLAMDAAAIRSEINRRQQLDQAVTTEIRSTVDTTALYLEVHAVQAPTGIAPLSEAQEKIQRVYWHGLQDALVHYPEHPALQQLDHLSQTLNAIMRQSDLMKTHE